ncbi:MarR family transcriptional regulator [Bacillus inaquosorum]|uniref:MarR family transcriptional regulator n=1 Tax=Bacillus inaquosorum TaxID=483913 RepID=UPI000A0F6C94|nr:MarR family transcriptional regulator [Bacillus inaquosorum]QJC88024.1 putative transcriptional regulator YhjH, MarR family [Bacillus subtilis]MCY8280089.1 MarR family transcriptional regulator [Bacillus inaquosorum]MCY8753299.1 MarR family transcriptional regulator [Bacillus inaquosorum]MCY8843601.1 MarR family transcriptional regulator [Bacillus inaquosorum]MCY8860361.1 MarR family transcriptional regulator [Bacillus inaquosorum]
MNTDHTKRNLFELYAELIHQQEKWEGLIKAFLADELKKLDAEHGSKSQLSMTEIHVLSCVGDNEPINVTSIAEKMNTTKATVSRISTKLLGAGFLHRTQLSDNKKEVYFRLTPAGKKLHNLHKYYHQKVEQRFLSFFDRYTEEEILFAERLFRDLVTKWYPSSEEMEDGLHNVFK